jgi:hypothetical protein
MQTLQFLFVLSRLITGTNDAFHMGLNRYRLLVTTCAVELVCVQDVNVAVGGTDYTVPHGTPLGE